MPTRTWRVIRRANSQVFPARHDHGAQPAAANRYGHGEASQSHFPSEAISVKISSTTPTPRATSQQVFQIENPSVRRSRCQRPLNGSATD